MEFVGSGFGGHLDDAAAGAAELRRVIADRHVELLHGFHGRIENKSWNAEREILRGSAVDEVVGVIPPAAGDREGGGRPGAVGNDEAAQPQFPCSPPRRPQRPTQSSVAGPWIPR